MTRRLLIVMGVVLAFAACTSIDCPVQNTVRTVYAIQRANGTVDTLKDTLTVVSTRLNRKDTILLSSVSGIRLFSLPIGYTNPEDTFRFVFRNGSYGAVDTVWVKKENKPHFESVDCGSSFFHEITAVRYTNHAIDSIVINNTSVTYDPDTENFYLYLKGHN
jgi:hypothetical protein